MADMTVWDAFSNSTEALNNSALRDAVRYAKGHGSCGCIGCKLLANMQEFIGKPDVGRVDAPRNETRRSSLDWGDVAACVAWVVSACWCAAKCVGW